MLDTAGIVTQFMEGYDDANSNNVGEHSLLASSSTNKKHHHKQPSNWMEIARFALSSTIRKAVRHYKNAGYFLGCTDDGIYNNRRRYKKQYQEFLNAGNNEPLSFQESIGGSKIVCGLKAFEELKKVTETHYKHEIPLPHYVVTATRNNNTKISVMLIEKGANINVTVVMDIPHYYMPQVKIILSYV